ncbi:gtpase-activating protein gyp10 [Diaporthe amygdali]|uniref:gtpase-activating protein gyp10 n=1 Tax=Phomopsis amygdali TaxID=1214568 RepID=UPI0022FEA177|nr:gtpase-activating protein gyp10 [Diaporthe amygdali]KAJ0117884.1 gtpase-activating protein gyp10 [Diaporthe amygdali]
MATEDELLTYGSDEIADEKSDHDPSRSPGSSAKITDSNAELQEIKAREVIDACRRRDIESLQALAESPGGFLTDELRQQAWPVLLGLPVRFPSDEVEKSSSDRHEVVRLTASEFIDDSWKDLKPHKEEEQVKLDVARAFVYYPNYESDQERTHQKNELSDLILSILRRYPYLCYFQGYHDICQVFLLVLPPSLRSPAVARLSALRIRDFMLPNLSAAIAQLRLIPDILRAADPALWRHLPQTEPFFALSGTLTMYAHDVQSLGEIARLFDVLLAREPVFSVYMFAQIVIGRRAELFAVPSDEPEMLHSILSKLPQPLDVDRLVAGACRLLADHPPESLRSWRCGVSPNSVLKTARSTRDCAGQSLEVGAYFFGQQILELQREERKKKVIDALWRYRKPAKAVGVAVMFGVLAYWIRRSAMSNGVAAGPVRYMTALVSAWWQEF